MRKSQITPERKQRKKRFFNSICTPPEHPDSPQNLYLWAFSQFSPLLKLDSSWRFAGQIIKYAVDSANFVDDSAHNALQYCERDFCCLGGHKVDGIDCTKCNCVIISSLITHYTNGTHVCQGCKILVRHPGWCHTMLCFVSCNCFVHFITVNVIGILNDADFFCVYFTDDTDSKTRTREWLTEYPVPVRLCGLRL